MARELRWGGMVLALGLFGCGPQPLTPEVMAGEFRQAGEEGVYLNETLQFTFSDELDRASVTRQSLRILDPRGRPVRGATRVEGDRVYFEPALPRSPDLSDGGFVPGAMYTVELVGFPFPDGLRSRRGAPLERSRRSTFVAVAGAEDPGVQMFDLPLADEVALLELATQQIGPLDPILLECPTPLDPRTVRAEAFQLSEGFELQVRLVRNDAGGAEIELRPRGESRGTFAALEPGSWYALVLVRDHAPRTLSGLPVQARWEEATAGSARVEVRRPMALDRLRVDFDEQSEDRDPQAGRALPQADLRSNEAVPGFDGTADWSRGRVTIRYPRAAGSGAEGRVELAGEVEQRDLHAARLTLPAGASASLPAEGLVVLRSQAALVIDGELARPAPAGEPPPMDFAPGDTLSAWLDYARAQDPAWTVLVAGGDLWISGDLRVSGPLLLVTGGRLRISGSVRASKIWKLGPGSGTFAEPMIEWVPTADRWSLPPERRFVVDEPEENPLVEPLRYAVLSGNFRPADGVAAWRPGLFGGSPGAGKLRLRWLGQRTTEAGIVEFGPVDDAILLPGADSLRFRIELEMPAGGGVWDPPTVDYVEFRWDAAPPGNSDSR